MSLEHVVTDRAGRRATLLGPAAASEADAATRVVLRLDDGRRVVVPADLLTQQDEATYRLDAAFDELAEREEIVLQEVEEHLRVGKRMRETGRVRLTRHVETREETVDEPLLREHVEVERVPVGTFVETAPAIRREGDITVIPVLEEVLVIEKRLRLVEELHVRKRREETHAPQTVTLRKERVQVERVAPPDDERAS